MIFVGRDVTKIEGQYANYFKVGHNAFEFVLDFGQFYPENGNAQLHTRIITSPENAKCLLELLQKSIGQYEKEHGPISKKVKKDPFLACNKKSCSAF